MRGAGGRGKYYQNVSYEKMNKKEIMKFTLTKTYISV